MQSGWLRQYFTPQHHEQCHHTTDLDTPEALRVLDRVGGSSEPAAKELLEEGREILGLLDL